MNLDLPEGFSYYQNEMRNSERIISRGQNVGSGVVLFVVQ